MDNMLEASSALDLEALIASLNPNEFEALQRYAPLFLDDAQTALDEAGVSLTADEPRVHRLGRRRPPVRSRSTACASGSTGATARHGDARRRLLDRRGWRRDARLLRPSGHARGRRRVRGRETVEDLATSLEAAFEDYENPGFIVQRVDGEWYLSPMATCPISADVLRALSREEIEELR